MPIYAYRCSACGHAQDVLQKMSDPLLTVCPSCGQSSYVKQVTAAAFQLKGTGWYVTDFRDKGNAPAGNPTGAAAEASSKPAGDATPTPGAAAATSAAPSSPPPSTKAPNTSGAPAAPPSTAAPASTK